MLPTAEHGGVCVMSHAAFPRFAKDFNQAPAGNQVWMRLLAASGWNTAWIVALQPMLMRKMRVNCTTPFANQGAAAGAIESC